MDNVVRKWLALMAEDQLVDQEGLGILVGRCMGLFYACYDMVGSRDPEWLQAALNMLINLFHQYRLVTNVAKYKAVIYQPGTLRSEMLEEAVGRRCTGRGEKHQERLIWKIPFLECGVELNTRLIMAHR